eukprot:8875963-Ditylum_brightwellii.AAC.1
MAFTLTKNFDDDEHGLANAGKHAKEFLLWAWGVKHGKVSEWWYEVNMNDGDIARFCKESHEKCISPLLAMSASRAPRD